MVCEVAKVVRAVASLAKIYAVMVKVVFWLLVRIVFRAMVRAMVRVGCCHF